MKVSDIMLDLATGDASVHDPFVQEAVGQVNVSAAIYDAAKQIASLDDNDRTQIVQEAVDAGLPYDREGALELIYEAVQHELIGTARHLYAESAKMDESATKATAPLAAVNALAKACGVKKTMNGSKEYAGELATAVIKNKDIDLKGGAKFCKAASAKKLTRSLIQGTALIANAFGISTDKLFDDDTVSAVVSAPVKTSPKKTEDGKDNCCLSYMTSALKSAGKYLSDNDLSENDYTTSITKNDIATVITCNFAAAKAAKFIKSNIDGKVEKKAEKAIAACKKKKHISGDAEDLNCPETGIKKINADLTKLNKNLIEAFNNSIYSLIEAKSNED